MSVVDVHCTKKGFSDGKLKPNGFSGFHMTGSMYKLDNSGLLVTAFHNTTEVEPKQFSFGKHSHNL